MTDRDVESGPAGPLLAIAGTSDSRGQWRERDAPPSYEVRRFVEWIEWIPFAAPDNHPASVQPNA